MIVLGFSGIPNGDFYYKKYGLRFVGHDSSVALVIDGKVAFAAEEERFSREKHTSRLPLNALQQALAWSGVKPQDIDVIAYTWSVTFQRLLHMFWHHPFKVMGMSPLGDPTRFRSVFDRLVNLLPEGRYETYRTAMVFRPGYCDRMLSRLFGMTRRGQGEPLDQQHFDVAAGLQAVTERVLFHLLHHLRKLTTSNDLCLAGGVFLNSLANGKIRRSGLFDRVHIPPVPGDHGGALGAAFWAYHSSPDAVRQPDAGFSAFCGPGFSDEEIEEVLRGCSGDVDFHRSADVAGVAADWLAAGQILGWFQGRMEYGPRALGHRSILASPLVAGMKDTVNARIKHREPYRPFAGAVPEDRAPSFFEMDGPSPYMQFVFPVIPAACEKIPAIVHNGTCRVQTVSREQEALFHDLLVKFGARTGVPVLLNTSFNDADEPIVCSPQHAVRTFLRTDLDALVMGSYVVRKVRNSNPDY